MTLGVVRLRAVSEMQAPRDKACEVHRGGGGGGGGGGVLGYAPTKFRDRF